MFYQISHFALRIEAALSWLLVITAIKEVYLLCTLLTNMNNNLKQEGVIVFCELSLQERLVSACSSNK